MNRLRREYQYQEALYEDSSTILYRGVKVSDGESVLLKLLKTNYPVWADIARLEHEYTILQSLPIQGVLKAYRLEDSHRPLALVLEDFEGEPLSKFLTQRSLELTEFLPIAIQLAETLAQLHLTYKIIHKNLKTANVLFAPLTGQVKLHDFSLATCLSRENQAIEHPNFLEGTLAYMSPEQTGRINHSLDYRTDFYSLGVVFYEILTGQLPFQSTEPLELIHCHIAKTPISPQTISRTRGVTEIPQAVSDIVMKLLAKTAEDRYQNALGLKADLENCLKMLQTTGQISWFQVGQLDTNSQFSIPQKLYGREREIDTLMAAFTRASQGTTEMLLVSGYSGIGKSSLVAEFRKRIGSQRGYFIWGKFDQFKRNIPYVALIQSFQDLIRQLLTESPEQIAIWQGKLLEALGVNGQVIIDVIPEVEQLIGPQPEILQLEASETQNRFHLVFEQFIQVFCQPEHPLVLFLDDLQWADLASLKLIQWLFQATNNQYLLLIGTYRNREVSASHPLMQILKKIQQMEIAIHEIVLQPLPLTDCNQLVTETFRCQQEQSFTLAELIFYKTQGNPFFFCQLLKSLYQDQLLSFNFERACWQWDMEKLQGIDITDNVVELMVNRIQKLLPTTQEILKFAACIGNTFSLEFLSIVNKKSWSETSADLWEALEVGFILPVNQSEQIPLEIDLKAQQSEQTLQFSEAIEPWTKDSASRTREIVYRFLHDRVQQAAYSLIPDWQKKEIHLKIGQLLLQKLTPEDSQETVFALVNHLNYGSDLLESEFKKYQLAELNLMAGQKAKLAVAYESAIRYLKAGLKQIETSGWHQNYQLILALHQEAAEVAFLIGDFEQMENLTEAILQHSQTLLDQIKAYEIRIKSYEMQRKLLQAVELGLQALAILGINLPQSPTPLDIQRAIQETNTNLAGKNIEDLINLPAMTDAKKLAGLRLMISLVPAAYQSAPTLFILMACQQVNLSIQSGITELSASGFADYGLVLSGILQDIEAGYQFGQLALKIVARLEARKVRSQTLFKVSTFILPWKHHIQQSLSLLEEAYLSGLDNGDLAHAGYSASFKCQYAYWSGCELRSLEKEMVTYGQAIAKINQKTALNWHQIFHQIVLNLIGESGGNPYSLMGPAYNEEQSLALHIQLNEHPVIHYVYLSKLILSYLFGELFTAVENAVKAKQYLDGVKGWLEVPLFHFYDSLVHLAIYFIVPSSQKKAILEQVNENQGKMQKWASFAPMNFLHKYELVEAEKARVLGQFDRAMEYYDRAIKNAGEQRYFQEEALAAELAAKFYFTRGRERVAGDYLREAYYGYLRWGATAKVKDLVERYPQVLSQNPVKSSLEIVPTYTSGIGLAALDLATAIQASQALSHEIVLDQLLDKLMNSAIENAGAITGVLLLKQGRQWVLVAEGFADRDNQIILPPRPLEVSADLPTALLNYAIRSQFPLVLNDASSEGLFTDDPYILKHHPKSVLCLPVIYQSKLKGMLYLENNLTKGAFSHNHVQILSLLASQAAISLENAGLYQELQTYSQKLENKNKELLQANQIKDEFLAVLSHELRTPMSPILGWVQLLRTGNFDRATTDRALEIIERNAKLEVKLIEDLLDISTILQGKLTLNIEAVEIAPIVLSAIETVNLAASAKSIQIQTKFEPGVVKVLGDANRLQQIFWNLLANAVKFTPADGRVEVRLESKGVYAQIEMSDTGSGISPEFLPFVFESFRQADGGTTRKFGGLGLGLAIVRHLVELHGGMVRAQSQGEGKGATFTVTLPLLAAHEQKEGTPQQLNSNLDLKGTKILVVDDEADMLELVTCLLEQSGAQVISVTSATEALTAIAHAKPDLLLSDIGMSEMDGYMLIRQLRTRSLEEGGEIPAIALTAYATEVDRQQALAFGFQSHITKPVDPQQLLVEVAGLVRASRSH
ncbi:MAG: AAA family ATPase [Actinomycetota bacterium]